MLKKLQFWLTALVLMCSASAYADVVEFSNYNFEDGDAIDNGVTTYYKDMSTNSTTYFGLQAVTDWTASTPADADNYSDSMDAMSGAVFAYGSKSTWLGSNTYYPPTTDPDGESDGQCLGVVAVWTATAYYTSEEVTLAPGNYRISIPVYNGAGTASITNLTKVTLSNGTTYSASNTTYTVGSWTTEKFYVSVSDTVTATVTLGYTAPNSGSGSCPHLFYDGVYIEPFDLVIVSPAENDEDSPYTISEDYFVVDGETTYSGITFTANIDGVEFNGDADYPYFTLYKYADSSWKGYSDDASSVSGSTDEFYAEYTSKFPDETGWYTAVFPEGVLRSSDSTSFTSNETSFHFYFEAEEEEENSGSAYTEIELSNDSFDISSSWVTGTVTGVSSATLKSVSGWSSKYQRSSSTHSQPAVAAASCQIGASTYISSYKGPTTNSTGGTDGGVLDIACGYDAYCYFYQSVTLEAGTYMLTYAAYNFNTSTSYTGDTIAVNLTGFVAEGDTVYSSLIDFPRKEWVLDTITFSLAEGTTGEVRVGYQADGNMEKFSWGPYLAYDYVSLVKVSNDVLTDDDDDDDDDDDTSDSSETLVDITLGYASPAEGDTVTQLEGIYLSATLADTLWNIEAIIDSVAELITVTDSEGNSYDIEGVTIGKTDITQVAIYFEDAITDEGTYTFTIPDGLLADSVYYYTGAGHISKGGEFSYIVASADITWTSDPADGDTLSSLSSIKIYADGGETAISSGYYNPVLYKDGEVYENISGANYTGGYDTEDWSTFTYWLNVALSDEITAEGTYTLVFGDSTIQVGDDNDNVYYLKDQLSFSWYVDGSAAPAYNVTCDPEDGSTVDSIYTFSITFNDYTTAAFSTTSAAYVYTDSACTTTYRTTYEDDSGNTLYRSYYTSTVVNDGNTITMTLNYPVTEDGTYYIQLPAKRLTLDGTTLSSSDDPLIISYTVKAPQYTVVPANGSEVTQIDTIALTFPNYAKISYRTGSVYIYKDGSYAGYGGSTSRYSVSGNTIKIWFNNSPFTDPAEYTVKIPSGYVYFYDNEDDAINYDKYLDDAIELTYTVVEATEEEEETYTPEEGDYYFKVAGEYQYLTRGGSWGTELVLGDVGALYTLVSTGNDDGTFYLESTDRKTAGFTKYYVSGPTSCYTDASSYATWSFETDDEGETWYIVNSNGNYLVGTYYSATGLTDKGYGYYYIGETSTKSDAPAFKLLSRDEYKADLAARLDEQAAAAATAAGLSATSVEEIEALGLTETDATESITNANYASSDGWSVEQTNGNRYLTSMGYSNNVAEVWNSTGEYYQKVSGLSEGLYKVTANAFTRMTSLTTFTSNDGLIDVASVTAYLYANTSTAENISSLGFYDDYSDWANVNSTTNVNTVITASDTAWLQTLYVYVAEGDTLTLGLVANGYTEYAWNTVANWTLTLLAEEEEEEEDDDTLDVPTYDDITIDPASGSTLTSITSFSVTYEAATSVNYTSYPYIYSDSACTTQVTYCKPSVSGNTVTFTAAKEVTDDGTYYIVVKDKATLDSSTTYGQDITIVYVVDSSYTGGTDDGDDDGDDDDDTTTTVTITPVTLVEGGEYETLEAGETIQFTIEPASSVGYAFYKLGTSEDGGDIKSRSTLTYNEETGYWEAEIVYDVKLDEEGIYVTVYAYASESDFNYSKDYLAYISYKIVGTAEKSVLSDVTLESITPTPTYEDESGDEVKGYLSSSENQTITLVFSDKVSIDSSTSFVNYGQGITYAFSSITASTDSTTWYLVVSASVMSAFTDGGMNITIVATDSEGNRVYSETYSESEDADYTYMNLLYYFSESTGLTNYTVSPADGETVDSLSTIVITYNDESVSIVPTWTAQITITDSTGTTTKVSLSEDYVSYDGNVITVDVSYLGLEDGTYTITIPEGFFCIEDDADSKNAEITITVTVSTPEEEATLDGDYYFKVSGEYQYLSRGGNWGTEAIIGEYGIGVSVVSNGDGTYAFRDRDVYLASGNSRGYLTGPTGVYADGDGGDGSWTLSENEDGTYYIINSNGNYVTFDEASGTASLGNDYSYLYFSETTDVESAYAFELLTDEEYAADLAARLDEYAAAVATSAGIEAETLEDLEAAVEDEEDYSDYIANADYTSSDDWTLEQINPATYSGTFDTTNGAFEIYGAAGNLYQTISGLDEGLYKVEVNALQRQFPASYYTTYETLADVDDDLSYLYATTATSEYQTQVATWTSYESYSDVNTIATFVEAADNYGNTLYVYVGEGEELTIGITQPDNSYYGAWTIATGWTLTLLSSETTDEDDPTVAISSISSEATFEPTAIYSVSGQLVRTQATSFEGLNKGIYIVNGQKVLVK